MFLKGQ